jgi:hypothetical protein
MATKCHSVRSLQDLCEEKLCDTILDPDTANDDFDSLEPRVQMLLFRRLRNERTRLTCVKRQLQDLENAMPRVDFQSCLGRSTNIPDAPENDTDRASHRSKWHYITIPEMNDTALGELQDNDWNAWQLHADPPHTKFKLCTSVPLGQSCNCKPPIEKFRMRISAQLMLYRITATFGMPPSADEYLFEEAWGVCLQHEDGVSVLTFVEPGASVYMEFQGNKKASDDALSLVNYLLEVNFRST